MFVGDRTTASTSLVGAAAVTVLFQRQSLFMEDLMAVNYPLPQMPNTIAVGDIMARAESRDPSPAK